MATKARMLIELRKIGAYIGEDWKGPRLEAGRTIRNSDFSAQRGYSECRQCTKVDKEGQRTEMCARGHGNDIKSVGVVNLIQTRSLMNLPCGWKGMNP